MSENRPKPYLGNPQETIAVLNRYKFAFQKKFGQNFLIDTHVLERIIDEAGITPDDFVLEIGPGIGTMTQYLACAAREVVAVEIDKVLIPILEGDTLKAFDNVTVINEEYFKSGYQQTGGREKRWPSDQGGGKSAILSLRHRSSWDFSRVMYLSRASRSWCRRKLQTV